MQRVILSIFLGILFFDCHSQNRIIDSLINSLNGQSVDSNIYKTYLQIAKIYADSAFDKSLLYFNRALDVAERSSDRKRVAHIYHQIGSMYLKKGELPVALENFNNALEIHEHLNNKKGVGQLLNDIGIIYKNWGKYDKALENYFSALKLFDEIGDEGNGAMTSNNIGQIYYYRGEYEKSIEYFKKYLEVNKKNKSPRAVAGASNNIASAYMELDRLDDALVYFVRSMRIYDSLGVKFGVAIIKDNIGSLFIRKKQYNDALLYNSEALKIFEEMGSQARLCSSLQTVGLAYSKLNQPELAIKYLNRSLDLAISLNQQETKKDVYETLSDLYMQNKQYEKSLSYYKLFIQIKDSLINSEVTGKIETIQAEYEAQKKEKELGEVNQKLYNQKIFAIAAAGIILLFIFLTALIIRENQHKKKIIVKAEEQTQNLHQVIGKTSHHLYSFQNEAVHLTSLFEKHWILHPGKEAPNSHLFFLKGSVLFVAFLSKGRLSDNTDILKLSIFDFFQSLNNLDFNLSIKNLYAKFKISEGVWRKILNAENQSNVDFWCIKKDANQQQFNGLLGAFRVDNQNNTSILNVDCWLDFCKGDRFYFYTTDNLNEFNIHEQELFQSTLNKTIARTLGVTFEEQQEIFQNSLELIEAGNEIQSNISIFAFLV